jgi:glycosyltransferase involved in cell wall biosynthesis
MARSPKISVGLPVRNGANYVQEAIDSILSQTFGDFELIIADNCSTDATESIVRAAAARDARIVYYRHARDLGGPANYNFVFSRASAPFFRWIAHDDIAAPQNLAACLTALHEDDGAILAAPDTIVIDESGTALRSWTLPYVLAASRPGPRFLPAAANWRSIPAIFGLMRSAVLARTRLFLPLVHQDRILLAELSLRGRFVRVPEALFFFRDHPDSYSRSVYNTGTDSMWINPQAAHIQQRLGLHQLVMLRECARAVHEAPLKVSDRVECWARLARFGTVRRVRKRIARELCAAVRARHRT